MSNLLSYFFPKWGEMVQLNPNTLELLPSNRMGSKMDASYH